MKRVFAALVLSAVAALLLAGSAVAVSETPEGNFTIYAAFIFAIVVLGMLLVHLSIELRNHTEILKQIERIEEHHHNERGEPRQARALNKKISPASKANEDHRKARRLKEIKKLVAEIKRI